MYRSIYAVSKNATSQYILYKSICNSQHKYNKYTLVNTPEYTFTIYNHMEQCCNDQQSHVYHN